MFMQQICVSLSAGILFTRLNESKNCKLLLAILMQMLANSYWELKCNLLCPLNLHIDNETMYIPNIKTCSVYYWN